VIRKAADADIEAVLSLWAPSERDGSANAYVSQAALTMTVKGDTSLHAYVVEHDGAIAGAFTSRHLMMETSERVVRIDSFVAADERAEREVYEWFAGGPQDFAGGNVLDVWRPCGEPGVIAEHGFVNSRKYLRLDMASLKPVQTIPLPGDLSLIGPKDERAEMGDWARLINRAFAGEWRHQRANGYHIWKSIESNGQLSIAAIDEAGRTIAVVLVLEEHRPRDPLEQPTANIALVCTDPTRMRERIGEAMLREALSRARAQGAKSATIRADLGSPYHSHELYRRIGFKSALEFCAWSRQL